MRRFLAHWLVILSAWTLVIKFLFPVIHDSYYGQPPGTHIYWDFWWVAHLMMAWLLLNWQRYSWLFGVCLSAVEIVIITVKFGWFLQAPDWTIWQTNWFINKIFVLLCFVVLLMYLMTDKARNRSWSRRESAGF